MNPLNCENLQKFIINQSYSIEDSLSNSNIVKSTLSTGMFRAAGSYILTSLWAGRSIAYLGILIPAGTAPLAVAGACVAMTLVLNVAIKIMVLPLLKKWAEKGEKALELNKLIDQSNKIDNEYNESIKKITFFNKKWNPDIKEDYKTNLINSFDDIKKNNEDFTSNVKEDINKLCITAYKQIKEFEKLDLNIKYLKKKNQEYLSRNAISTLIAPLFTALAFAAGAATGMLILSTTCVAAYQILILSGISSIPLEYVARKADQYVLKGYFTQSAEKGPNHEENTSNSQITNTRDRGM